VGFAVSGWAYREPSVATLYLVVQLAAVTKRGACPGIAKPED
jgi:hypothetical protein